MLEKDKWFYFAGGKSAKDLHELVNALKEIHDEEFSFHVNAGKNDFANWVEGVFNEKDLADEMRTVMEKKDTIDIIKKHLHRHAKKNSSLIEEPERIAKEKKVQSEVSDFSEAKKEVEEKLSGEEKKAEYLVEETQAQESSADSDEVSQAVTQGAVLEGEQGLDKEQLDKLVEETKEELEIEGRVLEDKEKKDKASNRECKHRFIVKEFIYGFIMGLIFGLFMLGALMNLT